MDGMGFSIIPAREATAVCAIIPALISDIKFAFRMLFRTPDLSFAAALVLALGLGATTAIFTLVERVLLSPLPYPDADRLVWIWNVPPRSGAGLRGLFATDIDEIRQGSRLFESMGGAFPGSWNVTGAGEPQRLAGVRVTADFFPTLGIQPQAGRLFSAGRIPRRAGNGGAFKLLILAKSFGRRSEYRRPPNFNGWGFL